MTVDRADPSMNFTWDDKVRTRVIGRAQEIRRKRRTVSTVLAGVILVVGVGTASLSAESAWV